MRTRGKGGETRRPLSANVRSLTFNKKAGDSLKTFNQEENSIKLAWQRSWYKKY